MTKKDHFLLFVQTVFIANCIKLKKEEMDPYEIADISATFAMGFMTNAFKASDKIPDSMSASEAAEDFLGYMLPNLREKGDRCPEWVQG